MEPTFTVAGDGDIEQLVELMHEFYAVEHLTFDEQLTRGALRQILSDGSVGAVYLVGDGDDIVGYLVLTFGFSLEFHGRDALIDELYLRESHRGRGFGKACLRHAEAVCRSEGVRALHLEVGRVNTRAQAVYRKAGYRDHDRHLLTKWLGEE